ncbi:MAG: thioredoxin domain-containing protein [Desulfobacterales bacterium]
MRVRAGPALLLGLALMLAACGSGSEQPAADDRMRKPLQSISDSAEFDRILAAAGDRLLIFDFFADWCRPCKELEPVLESIAAQHQSVTDIYRIAFDDNQTLAELFGVRGIPFVAFVKNRTLVYSLMGLRPKEAYLEAIASFTRPGAAAAETGSGVRLDSGVTDK